jgi:hypothetical protein
LNYKQTVTAVLPLQELLLLEELLSRPSQRRMDTKKLKCTKLNQVKKIKAALEHWKCWKEVQLQQLTRSTREIQPAAAAIAAVEAAVAAADSDAPWKEKLPWQEDGTEGMR